MSAIQLISILGFVVALLQNPSAYNMTPTQALSFSQNAVALVGASLTVDTSTVVIPEQSTTTITLPAQPQTVVGTPSLGLSTGGPTVNENIPQVVYSCTLTVDRGSDDRYPKFSWTSNITDNVTAKITWRGSVWTNGPDNPWSWSDWKNVPLGMTGHADLFNVANLSGREVPDNELYMVGYNGGQAQYHLDLNGTTCDYTVTQ